MTDEKIVSDAEIKSIEENIVKQENEKLAKIKQEALEAARKELAKEQEFKRLQEEKAKLEATVAKQASEKQDLETSFKAKEEELRSQIGSSKGHVDNKSPFDNQNKPQEKIDFTNLSNDDIADIDTESKDAFFKSQGLSGDWKK